MLKLENANSLLLVFTLSHTMQNDKLLLLLIPAHNPGCESDTYYGRELPWRAIVI